MTPLEWYKTKKKEYRERYNEEWYHLSMFGENQSSEVCETALRSDVECKILKASSPNEIEMIANAIMIRDYLLERKNTARGENEHCISS